MSGKRNPIEPGRLSAEEYEALMWNHLKRHEGMVGRIHTDGKGIPTMGVGIALAVQEKKNGPYVLRDLNKIGVEISGDANNPYRFKPEEIKLLQNTVGKLNDPNLDQKQRAADAKILIPPYTGPNSEAAGKNKFGFTLPEERMKSQAFDKVPSYREAALNTVREQAAKRGWSKAETDAYVGKLESSRQEGALTSLRYNGVVVPKASGALLDGERAALRDEILYKSNPASNGDNRTGIGRRRADEADMAAGDPKTWPTEEQARWRAVEGSPEAIAYRQYLPDVFGKEKRTVQETPPKKLLEEAAGTEPPAITKQQPIGADGRAFLDKLAQPAARPALEVAVKEPAHWTENEARSVIDDYQRHHQPEAMNLWLRERASDYYQHRFGQSEWRRDPDGKMAEVKPGVQVIDEAQPAILQDGRPLQKILEQMGGSLAPAFDADGMNSATKSMQQGLNILNGGRMPRLKEDGDWGPITDFSFKKSVASHGAAKVDEGFALGRLQSLAGKPQMAKDLSKKTQEIFGPLYGSHQGGKESEPLHALALQAGLNEIGPKHVDDWQPLKLDGDIGPKTADAFNRAANAAGPMSFAQDMGSWLGWL